MIVVADAEPRLHRAGARALRAWVTVSLQLVQMDALPSTNFNTLGPFLESSPPFRHEDTALHRGPDEQDKAKKDSCVHDILP